MESWDFWAAVGVAVVCGAAVGLERQLGGKALGMRTAILVCVGTVVFVRVGIESVGTTGDPSRVIGQVVTGIGFLGAGLMIQRHGNVIGLTTAGSVWMLAAIGVTAGIGRFVTALLLAALTVVVLRGLEWAEERVPRLATGVHRRSAEPPDSDHPVE